MSGELVDVPYPYQVGFVHPLGFYMPVKPGGSATVTVVFGPNGMARNKIAVKEESTQIREIGVVDRSQGLGPFIIQYSNDTGSLVRLWVHGVHKDGTEYVYDLFKILAADPPTRPTAYRVGFEEKTSGRQPSQFEDIVVETTFDPEIIRTSPDHGAMPPRMRAEERGHKPDNRRGLLIGWSFSGIPLCTRRRGRTDSRLPPRRGDSAGHLSVNITARVSKRQGDRLWKFDWQSAQPTSIRSIDSGTECMWRKCAVRKSMRTTTRALSKNHSTMARRVSLSLKSMEKLSEVFA